jgi:DNA-binding NarL/FixJ family response regulator
MAPRDSEIKKTTILVVEDHDAFREFVIKKLQFLNSTCTLVEAQNAEEGLSLAKTMEPDIVIMDIRLPKMSGIELTRRIKKLLPKTNVIILSLYDDPVYKEQAITAGSSAYVLKQQFQSELVPLLKELVPDAASTKINDASNCNEVHE